MINAVSSSSNPVSASAPYFPPTSPDHKPLIDLTDPPRETSPDLNKAVMTPETTTSAATSFPTPPPTPSISEDGSSPADVTTKKHFSPKMAVAAIAFVLMMVGAAAGFYLTQENQDLRQQASTGGNCCDDQGWVGMGRKCGDPGAPSFVDGWNACQAHQCGGCVEEEQKQCDSPCDQVANQDKCVSVGENDQRWCGNDCYMRSKEESKTLGCTVAGDPAQPPTPPDNSGLDPNVPRPASDICTARGTINSTSSTADPNCSTQGGVSCDIDSTNFCCYGDSKNEAGVVQRDGACYNSTVSCTAPYTVHKNACDGSDFCSVHVSTYTSNSIPAAENCVQFDIIGSSGNGCAGVPPANDRKTCGSTGGPNPPPVVDPPPTTVTHRQPLGHHDANSCETITGWSCDQDALGENVVIHIYLGSATKSETHIGTVTANQQPNSDADRDEILRLCGGTNANRRFSWTIPEQYRTQTDKYLWAFAINVGPDGKPSHVDGSTTAMQNPPLTNTPKQIVACTQPPVTPQQPTASLTGACSDQNPANGLNYTYTISNISGAEPFNHSELWLSFSSSGAGVGTHVQEIRNFLGTPDVDLGHWYGYRLHRFTTLPDSKTLTIDWNLNNSAKIGASQKTVAQLATETSRLLALPDAQFSQANKARIAKYNVVANLKMGGVQNDGVGIVQTEITNTACTTPVGPMCMLISAHTVSATGAISSAPANLSTLKFNDKIKFQCGGNQAATTAGYTYEFQLLDANKKLVNNLQRDATQKNYSETLTLTSGTFFAQCRICKPGNTEPVCQEWYYPTTTPQE